MAFSLMIHGGTGRRDEDGWEQGVLKSLRSVLDAGATMLRKNASALDTVETCVRLLEDDPLFNAGKGSSLTYEGTVEMDASIMDGREMRAGAIAGISLVKNPVTLARKVMETTEHVLLAGEGAMIFAKQAGVEFAPPEYFIIPYKKREWEFYRTQDIPVVQTIDDQPKGKRGTVGAVARDAHGHLAAATSTGGLTCKRYGRVGDSPIVGAGVFADDETCAVSATGYGEQFLRTSLAKTAADFVLHKGLSAPDASKAAIEYLVRKVKGVGGIIVIDHLGNCGSSCSDATLVHGCIRDDGEVHVTLSPSGISA